MARHVELSGHAQADFDESFDWYAKRSPLAAANFIAAIEEAIDKIVAGPHRFPATFGNCRYCRLKRYPFRLIYREHGGRIEIVAIAHASRDPGFWHGRV